MNFPCPKCQSSVSETALACPHCGKSFTDGVSTAPHAGPSATSFGAFGSPYAPPGVPPIVPMAGMRPPSLEAAAQARRAIQMGVLALLCFAPLAIYALVLAGRAEETARALEARLAG